MPPSDDKLPSLDELQQRIDAAKRSENKDKGGADFQQDMGPALRMGVELLAGITVGGVIGHYLDRWLGTSPLFLIVCFFLGAAAGFRNLLREARKMSDDNTK